MWWLRVLLNHSLRRQLRQSHLYFAFLAISTAMRIEFTFIVLSLFILFKLTYLNPLKTVSRWKLVGFRLVVCGVGQALAWDHA